MHSTVLMLRKDMYCAKIFLGNIVLLFILMWAVFSLFFGQMAVFYSIIIVYSVLFTLFGAEENEQMADINNTLPVTLNTRILSRYLFAWLFSVLIALLTVGILLLSSQFRLQQGDGVSVLAVSVQVLCSSLLIINLTFPFIYRSGLQKARIYVMIVYLVILATSALLQVGLQYLISDWNLSLTQIMLLLLAVLVLISPASLALSRKWARKK